jgi:hypothetical protein
VRLSNAGCREERAMFRATDRRTVRVEARALLRSLGDRADGVAHHLVEQGVTGEVRSNTRCPVAAYLHATLGGGRHVESLEVGPGSVRIRLDGRHRKTVMVPLPRPVQIFVSRFDRGGCYPELQQDRRLGPAERSAAAG